MENFFKKSRRYRYLLYGVLFSVLAGICVLTIPGMEAMAAREPRVLTDFPEDAVTYTCIGGLTVILLTSPQGSGALYEIKEGKRVTCSMPTKMKRE